MQCFFYIFQLFSLVFQPCRCTFYSLLSPCVFQWVRVVRWCWGEYLLGPGLVIGFAYMLLPVSNTFHWVLTSRGPLGIVIH